ARRMLFVAPHQHPPGVPFDWLQPDTRHALYVDDLEHPTPLAMADTDADLVTWREDGQLLELGRAAADSPLRLRIWNGSTGASQPLAELPLKPAAGYAATWDTSRARLLIASGNPSGGIDYWLAQLGLEAGA
ncbi:MAG TPA: hypothetical protein VF937_08060, partial [Chloroflexota bacterium]